MPTGANEYPGDAPSKSSIYGSVLAPPTFAILYENGVGLVDPPGGLPVPLPPAGSVETLLLTSCAARYQSMMSFNTTLPTVA